MSTSSLQSFLEFALDATYQAGRITLAYFQNGVQAERKADSSPVTIADKQAEQRLRELIHHYWPDHGIIGEEFGHQGGGSSYTWTIDPIDGTKSFVQGVPFYSTLLALTDGKRPLVGVAHFPALNETVYAAQGEGCYWNGRRTHTTQTTALDQAVVMSSEVIWSDEIKQERWMNLAKRTYLQRTWADAYGYALVATGRADIALDARMQTWDCGPLQVILEEAGGTFTDWKGTPTIYGGDAFATNGSLFQQVFDVLRL
jgi:histidinol phosphatase-like enzyme (inositol monophosphatase family)